MHSFINLQENPKKKIKFHLSPLFDILLKFIHAPLIFVTLFSIILHQPKTVKQTAIIIFGLAFFVSFFACSNSKKITDRTDIKTLSEDKIIFGTGGGFSGFYDGYVISKNGSVYSWRTMSDTPDTLAYLFQTTPDSAAFFFRYLDEIRFGDMESASSGNMNSFVELRNGNSKHRVRWSLDNTSNTPELTVCYSLARKYIQRNSVKK